MADSSISVTGGSVDTRTETTNNNHRQVMVLGDPANNNGVAPVDAVTGLTVNIVPSPTGGCSVTHLVSGASTNATGIKASAGQVYSIDVFNAAAYPIYVKLHNVAVAPTAGAGVVRTIGVQSDTGRTVLLQGQAFATGIGVTITKLLADSDTTAVASGDCVVDVEWK